MLRTLVAGAALLALSGCHRLLPGSVRCSGHGGPQWREYRSRHFILDTDLDRRAAAVVVADLERIQALITVALTGERREIPGYVRVVVPATDRTFRAIAPPLVLGYFTVGPMGEPTIVVGPDTLRDDPEVVAHELAHHWTWYFFPRQPLWFAEGIAQFVQTVASDTPGYRNAVGVVPKVRAGALELASGVPARVLLSWNGNAGDHGLHELWSWVLYDWLWIQRPKQLAEFQRRLGAAEDPAQAWIASFPDLDPGERAAMRKLDAALEDHRRRGELVYYQVTADADAAFTESPLPPADVHVLLANERSELEAALGDDPLHPVAWYMLAPTKTGAADALRASAAAHPGDWRAWYVRAVFVEDPAEQEAAYRKAVGLEPRSAYAQNDLGWLLARSGRPDEALPFARRAVELAPASPGILDTLAEVAARVGACDEALALQRRAVALAPGPRGEGLRGRLGELEARCARE